jgi:hypothetical protein
MVLKFLLTATDAEVESLRDIWQFRQRKGIPMNTPEKVGSIGLLMTAFTVGGYHALRSMGAPSINAILLVGCVLAVLEIICLAVRFKNGLDGVVLSKVMTAYMACAGAMLMIEPSSITFVSRNSWDPLTFVAMGACCALMILLLMTAVSRQSAKATLLQPLYLFLSLMLTGTAMATGLCQSWTLFIPTVALYAVVMFYKRLNVRGMTPAASAA